MAKTYRMMRNKNKLTRKKAKTDTTIDNKFETKMNEWCTINFIYTITNID